MSKANRKKQKKNRTWKPTTIAWFVGLGLFLICCIWYVKKGQAIYYYNLGNRQYKSQSYQNAETDYTVSLIYKPAKRKQCSVRINKALAMVTPITPESVTYDTLDETIQILENAIDVLVADNCAHRNDENGHNAQAQILKDEIEEYIEWLKENVKPPQESEDESDSQQPEKKDEEEEDEQQKQLREAFEEIQKQGMEERNGDLNQYRSYFDDYEYYSGKEW